MWFSFFGGGAVACSGPKTIKNLSLYLDARMDLNQLASIRLPSGHLFRVPLGFLYYRKLYSEVGREYRWNGLSYYFCFPSGNYSIPDMSSYRPISLANFDLSSIPIYVGATEHDPSNLQFAEEFSRRIGNGKSSFLKPSATTTWGQEFGLTVVTRHAAVGDFLDYFTEADPTYLILGASRYSDHGFPVFDVIVVNIYNRVTGLEVELIIPRVAFGKWQAIIKQVESQVNSWAVRN